MRKIVYVSVILCFISIIISKKSLAQVVNRDSSSQQNAFNNAVTLYYSSIGKQAGIFNGTEYNLYDPLIKGNAYFSDVNAFTPGSVYYDGAFYKNVPMLYDIYIDEVVALLYNHYSMYTLIKEKVAGFNFLNHHFVNINSDTSGSNSNLKSGFYDQLYAGKCEILIKREKNIQSSVGAGTAPEDYFRGNTKWFLRKNNIYYSFGGQGSLLKLLVDRKKELKQYIRSNQIKFQDKPEEAMVQIVSFYDHLTK
ncbi:MAG: hypothetical protein ACHQIM_01535 [Sphingobacteriales bacterium]